MTSVLRSAIAAAGAMAMLASSALAQPAGQAPRSYLVIPFENSAKDARVYWLAEASSVMLADDLQAFGRRAYTREERLEAFEQLQVPAVATLSRATVIRLGQLVGATHVVMGSFAVTGSVITVRAQGVRLDSGRMEIEVVESGPLDDLFNVFGRISRRVAGVGTDAVAGDKQPPLPVFEQYIKGLIAEATPTRVAYLEGAIKAAPGFDRARLALWAVHHDVGNNDAALAAATAVAQTSPLFARARFAAALSLLQLQRLDDAFAILRALSDQSSSATLLNNMGVIQLRRPVTPETGRATYYFNQALKLDQDDPDYYFNLGYAYWAEKDSTAAIFWLREAVRRNPADGEAHAVLAAALQATGSAAEAARERELATQLSSTYAEWAKKSPPAEAVPRRLERVKPSLEPSTIRRIDSVIASGQREQKELAAFHLDRGRRLFEQGSNTEAVVELRRALYLSPYEAEGHLLLGRIYLRTGQTAGAIDAFKIALWSQNSAEAEIALAQAYVQNKDVANARAALNRALVLDPTSVEVRELLSKLKP